MTKHKKYKDKNSWNNCLKFLMTAAASLPPIKPKTPSCALDLVRSRQRLARDLTHLYAADSTTKSCKSPHIHRDNSDAYFQSSLPLDVRCVEQEEGELYRVTFTCDLHPEVTKRKALETMHATGHRRYN